MKNIKNKQMFSKYRGGLTLWLVVVLGIIGVIFAVTNIASQSATDDKEHSVQISQSVIASEWAKGNVDSSVILVEYADFQCPACRAYFPWVKQLFEEFEADVKFVFRHFPLKQIHPNANISAIAAESAGVQGKFWEMHDMIFENQKIWSRQRSSIAKNTFTSYAEEIGLDIEKFKNDMKSKDLRKIVDESYREASRSGVNSTPTFFLNGEKIVSPRNYEDFKKLLDEAIANNINEDTEDVTDESGQENS